MNFKIRLAEVDDATELSRLFVYLEHKVAADIITAQWNDWAEAGNLAFVASNQNNKLLGAVTLHQMRVLHRPKPVGRITLLVVDELLRGQGIGKMLVNKAEEHFTETGCGHLEITSNQHLQAAHSFYKHLGYECSSLRFYKNLVRVQPLQ